jgi:hypothetical protein
VAIFPGTSPSSALPLGATPQLRVNPTPHESDAFGSAIVVATLWHTYTNDRQVVVGVPGSDAGAGQVQVWRRVLEWFWGSPITEASASPE